MHRHRLRGKPRGIDRYSERDLWGVYSVTSTVGSFVMAAGMIVVAANSVRAARSDRLPDTLVWCATSPRQPQNIDRISSTPGARALGDLPCRPTHERRP